MSSSRRSSGEIHILAMLDGQAGKPRRFAALPRIAWYGGAGVLACALLGAVAWTLHDQTGGGYEGRIPTGPAVVPLEIASEPLPNPALRLAPEPAQAQGAATVDAAAGAADGSDLPPPRPRPEQAELREGHHPALTRLPATAVIHATPAAAAAPATPLARARPAGHAAPKAPARPARTASVPARHDAAPHPKRAAVPAKPKPAPVDTDVALISAIIQHVNKRGELKDTPDCEGKGCASGLQKRP